MSIAVKVSGQSAQLIISDRFDSTSYKDFKYAYTPVLSNAQVREIEVDLSGLEYMDSAALGMLMQLDEKKPIKSSY